jgi:hypothetical protein
MRFSASVAGTGLSEAELRLKLLSPLPLRPKHRKIKISSYKRCPTEEKTITWSPMYSIFFEFSFNAVNKK